MTALISDARRTAMRKTMGVALFAGVLGTIPVADIAEAAEPVGGCGRVFELMSVEEVLEKLAAPDFEEAIRGNDRNADGYLCVMTSNAPGLVTLLAPYTPFIYTDNNAQRG
jgi:hypothetical protein